jgi:hypothetical protein
LSQKIKSENAKAVVAYLKSRGIKHWFRKKTRHYRLYFEYKGHVRSLTMSRSPSDRMAHKAALKEIKAKLEDLDNLTDRDSAA